MDFSDFLTHVLPSVGGCPDSVAVDHVIKAARTFCARTLVWNYAPPTITAEAGQVNYTLQLREGQELVKVLYAEVDGCEYAVPNATQGRQMTRAGRGNCLVMQGPFDFNLTPAPTIDGAQIVTDIAVKPALGSVYFPDDLGEHVPDIAAGAIASLCLIPRQEWTNDKLAGIQQGMFDRRIGVVGMKVARGLGSTRTNAKVVWF